jgi:hypothetical protein
MVFEDGAGAALDGVELAVEEADSFRFASGGLPIRVVPCKRRK